MKPLNSNPPSPADKPHFSQTTSKCQCTNTRDLLQLSIHSDQNQPHRSHTTATLRAETPQILQGSQQFQPRTLSRECKGNENWSSKAWPLAVIRTRPHSTSTRHPISPCAKPRAACYSKVTRPGRLKSWRKSLLRRWA